MGKTEQTQKRRNHIRNVIIRGVMVLVFVVVVLMVIENVVIPAMTNENISIEHGKQVISHVGLGFVLEDTEIPLDLQLIQSLRQEYSESAIKFMLRGAVLSGVNLGATAEQVCLTKLWVVEPLPFPEDSPVLDRTADLINILNEIPVESKLGFTFDDFCVERGRIKIRPPEDELSILGVLPFSTGLPQYYYPFDTRTLNLEIWVETEIEYEDETKQVVLIAPNVHTQYNLPDWQLNLFKEQVTPENREHPITINQLVLQRSYSSRLLTTTLLSSLFIIIIMLGFTRQIDAFIQASVAVLLTLLGIQDLLVPAATKQTTIVDQSILGLYVMFALVILYRLTIKPIWDYTRDPDPEDPEDDTGE